ncbi:NAD(P)-dependent alcohol dehydrogenase [Mycolicibacterium phocaicum]|uniref:NAD(P)-dependent alcohol dehydrogenase n=1 Tax=Mycolicibacterium phocaicum TaxID=319706 RepID=UPI00092C30AC|nr:NAD(P)-dependent alcohol dehydrogenase [Mycolicibacterium phocaicum]UCZ62494.1 NAD(P)-dependent alcohol dehydrogenase [Mycolicibacterium phocaicum]SHT67950.1 Zn-dependent alcohol dehydrogenase, class III [Mycobacteroides abscessus subsp. abscessus]
MQTRAAVLRDPKGCFGIEQLTLDDPAPDEVVVEIAGAGFCHTDLLPRVAPIVMPIVCGHEGAGIVRATGADVTDIAVGDHVVMSFDFCGDCRNCVSGHPSYCSSFFPRNMSGTRLDGSTNAKDAVGKAVSARWFGQSSFADYAVVAARNVVRVGAELPLELLGALGCGFQTGAGAVLNSLSVQRGTSIAVFGAGAVGLAAVMAARIADADTIVAVDLNPDRLELATRYGATHVIDGAADDLGKQLHAVTGGADYAFDTTGVPKVIGTAIDALHSLGVCGLVGVQRGELRINPMQLATGKTVMGIVEGDSVPRQFIPELIDYWRRGEFPFDELITKFPLADIAAAERAMHSGKVVKAVLIP